MAGSLTFVGNAEARQGDVTIYADRLTVYYLEEEKEVDRVVAKGNVRIVQLNRVATGEKAIFHRLEGRMVLSGQPRVTEGDNYVEGHTITLFLNEKKSVVTGGQGGRIPRIDNGCQFAAGSRSSRPPGWGYTDRLCGSHLGRSASGIDAA